MQTAPKNQRLHIGIFGRRNAGKSSILNALTGQSSSIVSAIPGTTTDPVEKPMELLPLGPVLFIDTAGIDDQGALGELRIERTRAVLDRVDIALLVCVAGQWGEYEEQLLGKLSARTTPCILVWNKSDESTVDPSLIERFTSAKTPCVTTSALHNQGIGLLRDALIQAAPDNYINNPSIAADLVPPGGYAILVVPIDKEAPKGRLILPQVQTIRDLLDNDSYCLVVKERELATALSRQKLPPALVVTDSQAFLKVSADTPPNVALTSFSILFARHQGDLDTMVAGAMAIDRLKPGARVLIAEACTHHPITEDIGTVKIPRWLTQYVGAPLKIEHARGHDFPQDPGGFDLVIHCGGCMWNRREMLSRILRCTACGVPITNYGLTIAFTLGIFERALGPFPSALDTYYQLQKSANRSNT